MRNELLVTPQRAPCRYSITGASGSGCGSHSACSFTGASAPGGVNSIQRSCMPSATAVAPRQLSLLGWKIHLRCCSSSVAQPPSTSIHVANRPAIQRTRLPCTAVSRVSDRAKTARRAPLTSLGARSDVRGCTDLSARWPPSGAAARSFRRREPAVGTHGRVARHRGQQVVAAHAAPRGWIRFAPVRPAPRASASPGRRQATRRGGCESPASSRASGATSRPSAAKASALVWAVAISAGEAAKVTGTSSGCACNAAAPRDLSCS